MGNLFLSFSIAISGAIGLVTISRIFDLDPYINRILPIIPIFYAIVYEVLERRKSARLREVSNPIEGTRIGYKTAIPALTAGRVITDVVISFISKYFLEIFLTLLFIKYSGQSFESLYGNFTVETIARFLRGAHPWLEGNGGLYLLGLEAIITSIITGLWIGYTARGNAILEGVLTGAVVALINSMTNMLVLYRSIEEAAERLANSMGYVMRTGFLVVLALQVLLYGLWSGLVQSAKEERALRDLRNKPTKKGRK